MRMGIMQPYFFPYPGHFALIAHTDHWLVFDITQYTPRSWMNRNRILHPTSGWQYVTVPLANASISITTAQAQILDRQKAKTDILGKLAHYKKRAPYFRQVTALVEDVFDNTKTDSLVALNVMSLKAVCTYLDIPFHYQICSEMDLDLPANMGPGDWAPAICARVGATHYVNPSGGRDLFRTEDFTRHAIGLSFAEYHQLDYPVRGYSFEPHLSILDAMMWLAPAQIADHLRTQCHIVPASPVSPLVSE